MKKIALLLLAAAALNSTLAFSQEKTRAEVYQELVASEKTTLDPSCYTKSSYPGITLACQMRADEQARTGSASALASTSTNNPQQN
jgi:hypothetical protein